MAKIALTPDQIAEAEKKLALNGAEDFSAVAIRRHNIIRWSFHVFGRQPSTQEMAKYEEMASRVKFRGNKAEVEGSQIMAAVHLYDRLIERVYDLQVGRSFYEALKDGEKIRAIVPPMVKREAIREFLSNVIGATSLAEAEGDEEVAGTTEGD